MSRIELVGTSVYGLRRYTRGAWLMTHLGAGYGQYCVYQSFGSESILIRIRQKPDLFLPIYFVRISFLFYIKYSNAFQFVMHNLNFKFLHIFCLIFIGRSSFRPLENPRDICYSKHSSGTFFSVDFS